MLSTVLIERATLQEVGQVVQAVAPVGCLSAPEAHDVCFAAFPDSVSLHSHRLGVFDHVYTFRLRRHNGPPAPVHPPAAPVEDAREDTSAQDGDAKDDDSSVPNGEDLETPECSHTDGLLSGGGGDSEFLYGYVVSRVRSDPALKRGCEQRAVVVLSTVACSQPLMQIARAAAATWFDALAADPASGPRALASLITHTRRHWPPLRGSEQIPAELPLPDGSTVRVVRPAPQRIDLSHVLLGGQPAALGCVAAALADACPQPLSLGVLGGECTLPYLWRLWEAVLLGEHILIIGPTPAAAAECVSSLVSLLNPLPVLPDFRPFFTIHDNDSAALISTLRDSEFKPPDSQIVPQIIGTTNVFFVKALPNCPNIVSVGNDDSLLNGQRLTSRESTDSSVSEGGNENAEVEGTSVMPPQGSGRRSSGSSRVSGPQTLLAELKDGFWGKRRGWVIPDPSLLTTVRQRRRQSSNQGKANWLGGWFNGGGGQMAADAAAADPLRRHFEDLMIALMQPFLDVASVTLPKSSIAIVPKPPPVEIKTVVDHVRANGGPSAPMKTRCRNWEELFKGFANSALGRKWSIKVAESAYRNARREQARRAADVEIESYVGKLSEIEAVDAYVALTTHHNSAVECGDKEISATLHHHLAHVLSTLPADTRDAIKMAAKLRAAANSDTSNQYSTETPDSP